jgi:hypothetical protein
MRRIVGVAALVTAAVSVGLFGAGCNNKSSDGGGAAGASKSASAMLDDAQTAMNAEDWKTAIAALDAVIADPKAGAEDKVQAWQDKVMCEARGNGDQAAIATLQKMDDAKVAMTPSQFAKLGGDLANADKPEVSLKVLEIATKRYEHDEAAKKLFKKFAANLRKKFAASGDAAGQQKLDSLGYLGGSEDE